MRLPIFQFANALDSQDRLGAIFPSELEDNIKQSILFAVPILLPYAPSYGLLEYINKNQFYFPIAVEESYAEIEGRFEPPFLIYKVPGYSNEVVFQIYFPQFISPESPDKEGFYIQYVGKYDLFKNKYFLPILPVSMKEMNNIYLESSVAFVGYTPNFGEINLDYFRR